MEHHFIEHGTNSNVIFFLTSNELECVFKLASNERTSNNEPNRPFTRFSNLLMELTQTSFFRTSNQLERVHLSVIEHEHPIFGFEGSNITRFTISLFELTQ